MFPSAAPQTDLALESIMSFWGSELGRETRMMASTKAS